MPPEFARVLDALSSRPEILGIIALVWAGVVLTRRKAPYQRKGKSTPMFELVMRSIIVGVAVLGSVLIIREIGKALQPLFN